MTEKQLLKAIQRVFQDLVPPKKPVSKSSRIEWISKDKRDISCMRLDTFAEALYRELNKQKRKNGKKDRA